MAVSAASAAVASFSGLRGLAQDAGWAPALAWLLPITVDAHATTSARVWLSASTSIRARGFARANALGAITASIAGNAVFHALGAGLMTVTWPIIVAVGAVPAAVLGLTAHLHALRTTNPPPVPVPVRVPDERPDPAPAAPVAVPAGPRHRAEPVDRATQPSWPERPVLAAAGGRAPHTTEDVLWGAARRADRQYRREHHGRPITRDALRSTLHIGGQRATELRRRLAAETTGPVLTPPSTSSSHVPDRKEPHNYR
jgi:hypothetical protein